VQRGNAEIQRRAQEVIDRCWALGEQNPIALIHDVGAGGLANAVPEAVAHSGRGARIDLRAIPSAAAGMSPLELWCNEAQERYVLAIAPQALPRFAAIAERERCPFAVIGETDASGQLAVRDPLFADQPVDMPLEVLLGKPPRLTRDVRSVPVRHRRLDTARIQLREAAYRVLRLPQSPTRPSSSPSAIAPSRAHQPRSAGGALAGAGERCGGEQRRLPRHGRRGDGDGRAHAGRGAGCTGVRAPRGRRGDHQHPRGRYRFAVAHPPVGNWMAACGEAGEDAALYATVQAVGKELCPQLGIAIPVGKDSLSMKSAWSEGGVEKSVVAPLSLIVSAFAPVKDVRRTLTPALQLDERPTSLWLIDLSGGRNRLGASALAQVYGELGEEPADLNEPQRLTRFASALAQARAAGMLRAYHDRSDGGLFVTLLEMAFAGHCGLDIALPEERGTALAQLFSEEPGVVVQIAAGDEPAFSELLARHELADAALYLGAPVSELRVHIRIGETQLDESWVDLKRAWSETSWRLRRLRDEPQCADEEFAAQTAESDPGLSVALSFDPEEDIAAPYVARGARRRSPSCASRASTAMSRPRPFASAPGSPRTMCT